MPSSRPPHGHAGIVSGRNLCDYDRRDRGRRRRRRPDGLRHHARRCERDFAGISSGGDLDGDPEDRLLGLHMQLEARARSPVDLWMESGRSMSADRARRPGWSRRSRHSSILTSATNFSGGGPGHARGPLRDNPRSRCAATCSAGSRPCRCAMASAGRSTPWAPSAWSVPQPPDSAAAGRRVMRGNIPNPSVGAE
jgi:hypothetical protein